VKEKIKKTYDIGNIVKDITKLLIFVGVIGGLIYGLIKENEVVTFLLAILGLLFLSKIIWETMEGHRINKRKEEEEVKKITEKYFGKDNN